MRVFFAIAHSDALVDLKVYVGGFPVAVLVLLVGAMVAALVYFTSSSEKPPVYQWVFGYLGFLVSVVWIYGLANEVVDLLQAIGIMFDLSDSILGLTVLAWGNSLGGIFDSHDEIGSAIQPLILLQT